MKCKCGNETIFIIREVKESRRLIINEKEIKNSEKIAAEFPIQPPYASSVSFEVNNPDNFEVYCAKCAEFVTSDWSEFKKYNQI